MSKVDKWMKYAVKQMNDRRESIGKKRISIKDPDLWLELKISAYRYALKRWYPYYQRTGDPPEKHFPASMGLYMFDLYNITEEKLTPIMPAYDKISGVTVYTDIVDIDDQWALGTTEHESTAWQIGIDAEVENRQKNNPKFYGDDPSGTTPQLMKKILKTGDKEELLEMMRDKKSMYNKIAKKLKPELKSILEKITPIKKEDPS